LINLCFKNESPEHEDLPLKNLLYMPENFVSGLLTQISES
jgi:hypothetical protein